jgi:hypothetical protein
MTALDGPAGSPTIGGMLVTSLLVLAILATGAALFQATARLGILGSRMESLQVQHRHAVAIAILACVFWAAWYYLADM